MRKIFLTSGLVVCMACPAFAAYDISPTPNQGTNNYPLVNDPSSGIADCTEPTLGSYTGPTTFYAKWTKSYITVNLDSNTSNQNGAVSGSFSTGTNVTDELYATSTTMYKTLLGTGALDDIISLTNNTNTTVLSGTNPTGHTVTLSFNPNYSYINGTLNSNSTNYSTGITGVPSSDTVTRAFDGFYGNANGTGDDFIDETGVITAEGIAAATAAVAQGDDITWYANYKCAEPAHTGTPELRGYHFDGWYATAAATGDALSGTDWCLVDATNEVFAKWTAHTGTLTYACGTLPDPNPTQTIQGNGSSESVTYDHSVTLKDAATAGCSVQGYHFIGWKCNYDLATGEAYSDTTANYTYTSVGPAHTSGSFDNSNNIIAHYAVVAANGSDNANVTCTAMWEANTIGLTWTVGTGATANPTDAGGSSCTYDGDIDLPGTPTKPGYTFQGWSVTNPEPQTSEPTEPTGGQG